MDDQNIADEITSQLALDSDAGPLNLYMPPTYKARAKYLAQRYNLHDNRGNPSISLLMRMLIDKELVRSKK